MTKKSYPSRKTTRLKNYDYASPGAYFVTVCTHKHVPILSSITDSTVKLTRAGTCVRDIWFELTDRFPHIVLDEFMVMPNHVHGIIIIQSTDDAMPENKSSLSYSLIDIMRVFKSLSARMANKTLACPLNPFWQRSYYERAIRNDRELEAVRQYILNNPMNWELDNEKQLIREGDHGRI